MSMKSLLHMVGRIGCAAAAFAALAVLGSCDDGDGSSVRAICSDYCQSVDECQYSLNDEEMDECVDDCVDDAHDEQDEECYDEGRDYYECYYAAILENDCDWSEAQDDCDSQWEDLVDCDGYSDGDADVDGDADGDADADGDVDYCDGYSGSSDCCTEENTCDWAEDEVCDCDGTCSWDWIDCESVFI